MSFVDELNKVGGVILALEQRIALFIDAAAPIVTAINPVAGAALKEIDVALGIVAYAASKAENMQNQVNLSAISTALINNPDKAKEFLDSVILGISTVAATAQTIATQTTTVQPVAAPVATAPVVSSVVFGGMPQGVPASPQPNAADIEP